MATVASADPFIDSYTLDRSKLPQTAQDFLNQYFPKAKIATIKIDRALLKKAEYDVKLTNGTKIEFKNNGAWKSVDCKTREIPDGLMLKSMVNYLNKNFPDQKPVKIEKKTSGYVVELNDDIEVKFDRLGTYKGMKIDD